jgi:hypothetical protein
MVVVLRRSRQAPADQHNNTYASITGFSPNPDYVRNATRFDRCALSLASGLYNQASFVAYGVILIGADREANSAQA